jgi:hypothetical protein
MRRGGNTAIKGAVRSRSGPAAKQWATQFISHWEFEPLKYYFNQSGRQKAYDAYDALNNVYQNVYKPLKNKYGPREEKALFKILNEQQNYKFQYILNHTVQNDFKSALATFLRQELLSLTYATSSKNDEQYIWWISKKMPTDYRKESSQPSGAAVSTSVANYKKEKHISLEQLTKEIVESTVKVFKSECEEVSINTNLEKLLDLNPEEAIDNLIYSTNANLKIWHDLMIQISDDSVAQIQNLTEEGQLDSIEQPFTIEDSKVCIQTSLIEAFSKQANTLLNNEEAILNTVKNKEIGLDSDEEAIKKGMEFLEQKGTEVEALVAGDIVSKSIQIPATQKSQVSANQESMKTVIVGKYNP